MEVRLSHEATVAMHLMDAGWELHLSEDPGLVPVLVKSVVSGMGMFVKMEDISHGDVLELQQAGLLERHHRIVVRGCCVTVFRRSGVDLGVGYGGL